MEMLKGIRAGILVIAILLFLYMVPSTVLAQSTKDAHTTDGVITINYGTDIMPITDKNYVIRSPKKRVT